MPNLIGVVFVVLLLLGAAEPGRGRFAKYKAIEAYELRPGFIVLPRYTADGQVCQIGLEKLHYSPDMVRLDSELDRKDIDEIFNELVPADERGPRSKEMLRDQIDIEGNAVSSSTDFENVSIEIYAKVLATHKHGGMTIEEVAAAAIWRNRKCQ